MKIHEYQAKTFFAEFGIPVTPGIIVSTAEEADAAASKLGFPVVLKAQVHVGGRGKAGGIKVIRTPEEAAPAAQSILSMSIKDLPVRKLLVTPAVGIKSEVYISLLIDRTVSKTVFIGCSEGGVEIEQTAKSSPEKILHFEVPAEHLGELDLDECRPFTSMLFADPELADESARIMAAMGKMFVARDCSLIEINPLVVTSDGSVVALDAKVLLDDNALFRHQEYVELKDEPESHTNNNHNNLSFVKLDGEIGCMVNGAGLAMATMDIVKHFGGSPANFLDVGGSSDPRKVVDGFRMILEDKRVRVIFLNIFGGITRCDDIVNGIIAARELFDVPVPIVIRMAGTNEAEGRALLNGSDMIVAESLEEGAKKAVEMGRSR